VENEFDTQPSGQGFLKGEMENITGEIIDRRQLENGMELIIYDCSRSMTEDRCIIEIQCKAFISLEKSYWDTVADEDMRYSQAIREMLGEKLVFSSSQKRTFVDAEEKETILREMVQQVYDSILEYLNRPYFPHRLFEKLYKDARRKVLIREDMDQSGKALPAE
jgi:hypothetical protein